MVAWVRCDASVEAEVGSLRGILHRSSFCGVWSNHTTAPVLPLCGVIHAAGVLADGTLSGATPSALRASHAAKAVALRHLAQLSHPSAFLVSFSSVAALLGSPGQGCYAAANARLESHSERLASAGVHAIAVQWGGWAGGGMAARDSHTAKRLAKIGLGLVDPAQGLDLLRRCLCDRAMVLHSPVAVTPMVPESLGGAMPEHRDLVSEICRVRQPSTSQAVAAVPHVATLTARQATVRQVQSVPQLSQQEVLSAVSDIVADLVGRPLGPSEPLVASGLDSMGAVELRASLQSRFGVPLEPTLAINYTTVAEVAEHVWSLARAAGSLASPAEGDNAVAAGAIPVDDRPGMGPSMESTSGSADAIPFDHVLQAVQSKVEELTGSRPDAAEPLMASGIDSLGAVELRQTLSSTFSVDLPPTLVLDHPTAGDIAQLIYGQLGGPSQEGQTTAQAVQSLENMNVVALARPAGVYELARGTQGTVAIVAAAHVVPWDALSAPECRPSQADSVTPVPPTRWGVDDPHPYGPLPRFGSFMQGFDVFDAPMFGMSIAEAMHCDPQQHLVLSLTLECLTASRVWPCPAATSVHVGIGSCEYATLTSAFSAPGPFTASGGALSVAAGRVSYTFGLKGPSMAVDTACSASLVALQLSSAQVASGASVASITAGVQLFLAPGSTLAFHRAGMLAADGRCKTFDAAADGYVRSEGCVVFLLSRVADGGADAAQLAPHHVSSRASPTHGADGALATEAAPLARVLGVCVAQDGRSSSLTAPHGPSQSACIQGALRDAGVGPGHVAALQSHGTGTALGDPVEVGAVMATFRASNHLPIVMMAAKSWIGHGETAAGALGVLHATRTLTLCTALPILHLHALNPHIQGSLDSAGHRVSAPRMPGPMPTSGAATAVGVSSFAFQGTLAHAILGRCEDREVSETPTVPWRATRASVVPHADMWHLSRVLSTTQPGPFRVLLKDALWSAGKGLLGGAVLSAAAAVVESMCADDVTSSAVRGALSRAVLGHAPGPSTRDVAVSVSDGQLTVSDVKGTLLQSHIMMARRRPWSTITSAEGSRSSQQTLLVAPVHSRHSDGDAVAAMAMVELGKRGGSPGHDAFGSSPLLGITDAALAMSALLARTSSQTDAVGHGVSAVDVMLRTRSPPQRPGHKQQGPGSHTCTCTTAGSRLDVIPGVTEWLAGVVHSTTRKPPMAEAAWESVPAPPSEAGPLPMPAPQASAADAGQVLATVRSVIQAVLGEEVADEAPLLDAGLDSLGAAELQQRVQDEFGVALPIASANEQLTIAAVARHVMDHMARPGHADAKPAKGLHAQATELRTVPNAAIRVDFWDQKDDVLMRDVCVLAMSGPWPAGRTSTPDVFSTVDQATRVPLARWDVETQGDSNMPLGFLPHYGVFLQDVEMFDAAAFRLTHIETLLMDPQQRLLLLEASATLQGARARVAPLVAGDGVAPPQLPSERVGVYVGIATRDYEAVSVRAGAAKSVYGFTSASASVASGRVAFCLGLGGETVSVDTACAASLVAAHMAAGALRWATVDAAIVGGVLLCLAPDASAAVALSGLLAADGRSKSLDAAADGYARGENCTALVLANADAGVGQAVVASSARVLASAVNANRLSSSLTAPHAPSQQALLRDALRGARLAGSEVDVLHMHSNGVAVGDAAELAAALPILRRTMGPGAVPLQLTSHKAFTGHGEAGSGAQSLANAMRTASLASKAPFAHLRSLSPHVASYLSTGAGWAGRQSAPLPACRQVDLSVLGVSSFGAQGTNAHVLIEAGAGHRISDGSEWPGHRSLRWQRKWVHGRILSGARLCQSASLASLTFSTSLTDASLVYAAHVFMSGARVVPGSVLMNLASSAVAAAIDDAALGSTTHQASSREVMLVESMRVQVMELTKPSRRAAADNTVTVRLDVTSGALTVTDGASEGPAWTVRALLGAPIASGAFEGVERTQRAAVACLAPTLAMRRARPQGWAISAEVDAVPDDAVCDGAAEAQQQVVSVLKLQGPTSMRVSVPDALGPGFWAAAVPLPGFPSPGASRYAAPTRPSGLCGAAVSGFTSLGSETGTRQVWRSTWTWEAVEGKEKPVLEKINGSGPRKGPSDRTAGDSAGPPAPSPAAGRRAWPAVSPEHAALLSMGPTRLRDHVLGLLSDSVTELTGDALEPDTVLLDSGIDSRVGMMIRQSLSAKLHVDLPASLLYDFPTPMGIAEHIAANMEALCEAGSVGSRASADTDSGEGTSSGSETPARRGTVDERTVDAATSGGLGDRSGGPGVAGTVRRASTAPPIDEGRVAGGTLTHRRSDTAPEEPASHAPVTADAAASPAVEAGIRTRTRTGSSSLGVELSDRQLELLAMDRDELLALVSRLLVSHVTAMTGEPIATDAALMSAGLDSRAGMQLRQALSQDLGVDLPPTLLYDWETVAEVATFIADSIALLCSMGDQEALDGSPDDPGPSAEPHEAQLASGAAQEKAEGGTRGALDSATAEVVGPSQATTIDQPSRRSKPGSAAVPAAPAPPREGTRPVAGDLVPSDLLKTLRGQTVLPLFLAAPGVANAQSAYYSFSRVLAWSSSPILVLDKDDDLCVADLARANVQDILKVQPQGPFLLGGHSYGGVVALEVAIQLERLGHDVGLVFVMDSPLPHQVRPLEQSDQVTRELVMEFVEMILGALGRDAIGMGSGISHPRESEEWRGMSFQERMEFFAPVWRIMRNANLTLEECIEQIAFVTRSVRQGSEISDLRRHTFSGRLSKGRVVYFRGARRGACDYVQDGRQGPEMYGVSWLRYCDQVEVVDVPGDHFSLLRQEEADMAVLANVMKAHLLSFGWSECLPGSDAGPRLALVADRQIVAKELREMGVDEAAIEAAQRYLSTSGSQLPGRAVGAAGGVAARLQRVHAAKSGQARAPVLVVGWDQAIAVSGGGCGGWRVTAGMGLGSLVPDWGVMERDVYTVELPQEATDPREGLEVFVAACVRAVAREPGLAQALVLAAEGLACNVAYEVACRLEAAGTAVVAVAFWEDGVMRALADAMRQPWARCWPLVARMGHLGREGYVRAVGRCLAESGDSIEEQLVAIMRVQPPWMASHEWEEQVLTFLAESEAVDDEGGALLNQPSEELLSYTAVVRAIASLATDPTPGASQGVLPAGADTGAAEGIGRSQSGSVGAGVSGVHVPSDASTWRSGTLPAFTEASASSLVGLMIDLMGAGDDYKAVVEAVAARCPGCHPDVVWERLARHLGHIAVASSLARAVEPTSLLQARALFLHSPARRDSASLAGGWAAGMLAPIASFVQPVLMHQVNASLMEAIGLVEAFEAGMARLGPSAVGEASASGSAGPSESACLVKPNWLCPGQNSFWRLQGSGVTPTMRLPVWLCGPSGDSTAAIDGVCAAVPFPCYALYPGSALRQSASLSELATEMAVAVDAVQPRGPVVLVGVGYAGAPIAAAVAAQVEARGRTAALVLVDGSPTGTPEESCVVHAMFQWLCDQGAPRMPYEVFAQLAERAGAGGLAALLEDLRPSDVPRAQWTEGARVEMARAQHLQSLLEGSREVPRLFRGYMVLLYSLDKAGSQIALASKMAVGGPTRMMGQPIRHGEFLRNREKQRGLALALEEAVRVYLSEGGR